MVVVVGRMLRDFSSLRMFSAHHAIFFLCSLFLFLLSLLFLSLFLPSPFSLDSPSPPFPVWTCMNPFSHPTSLFLCVILDRCCHHDWWGLGEWTGRHVRFLERKGRWKHGSRTALWNTSKFVSILFCLLSFVYLSLRKRAFFRNAAQHKTLLSVITLIEMHTYNVPRLWLLSNNNNRHVHYSQVNSSLVTIHM